MPISLLDIIDSAVKIGLGAAITAFAGYTTVKSSHSNERAKELRAHRLKSLEMISDNSEAFFNVFLMFQAECRGMRLDCGDDVEHTMVRGDDECERLREVDRLFPEVFAGLNTTIARLHLLQANAAIEILESMKSILIDFRNTVVPQRTLPTTVELTTMYKEFGKQKTEFYTELSKIYLAV